MGAVSGNTPYSFQLNEANYKTFLKVKDKASFVKKADSNGDRDITDDEMKKVVLSPEEISEKEQLTYTDGQESVTLLSWDDYKRNQLKLDTQQKPVYGSDDTIKDKKSTVEGKDTFGPAEEKDAVYGPEKVTAKVYSETELLNALKLLAVDDVSIEEIKNSGVLELILSLIDNGAFTWKNLQDLLDGQTVNVGGKAIDLGTDDNKAKKEVLEKLFRKENWWGKAGWTKEAFKVIFNRETYGTDGFIPQVNSRQELVEMAAVVDAWNKNTDLKEKMGYDVDRKYQTYERYFAKDDQEEKQVKRGGILIEREGEDIDLDMDNDGEIGTRHDLLLIYQRALLKLSPEQLNTILDENGRIDFAAADQIMGLRVKDDNPADNKAGTTDGSTEISSDTGTQSGDIAFELDPVLELGVTYTKKQLDSTGIDKDHMYNTGDEATKCQILASIVRQQVGKKFAGAAYWEKEALVIAHFRKKFGTEKIQGVDKATLYATYLIRVSLGAIDPRTKLSEVQDRLIEELKGETKSDAADSTKNVDSAKKTDTVDSNKAADAKQLDRKMTLLTDEYNKLVKNTSPKKEDILAVFKGFADFQYWDKVPGLDDFMDKKGLFTIMGPYFEQMKLSGKNPQTINESIVLMIDLIKKLKPLFSDPDLQKICDNRIAELNDILAIPVLPELSEGMLWALIPLKSVFKVYDSTGKKVIGSTNTKDAVYLEMDMNNKKPKANKAGLYHVVLKDGTEGYIKDQAEAPSKKKTANNTTSSGDRVKGDTPVRSNSKYPLSLLVSYSMSKVVTKANIKEAQAVYNSYSSSTDKAIKDHCKNIKMKIDACK